MFEFGHVIEEAAPPRPLGARDYVTSDRVFAALPTDEMRNRIQ